MATNITVAPSPDISLSLRLQASVGRNQVQRSAGLYSAIYLVPNTRVDNVSLELATLKTFTSNSAEQFKNIVISCSSPLTFSAIDANDVALTWPISTLLVLDAPLKSFTLTNSGTDTVRVSMNTVSFVP
jgi:hypothetical protein